MLNRDIYNKSPKENRLVNNGVAEVSEDHSEAAQAILRYELETFVCDGQYEKGLDAILDTFLRNLNAGSEQPGVATQKFTVGQDDLVGTAGKDKFVANVVQNINGEQTNSLATGDSVDGGAGQDSLFATVQQASALNQGPASAIMPARWLTSMECFSTFWP